MVLGVKNVILNMGEMGTEAGNLEWILGEIEKMCKEFSACQMFMEDFEGNG